MRSHTKFDTGRLCRVSASKETKTGDCVRVHTFPAKCKWHQTYRLRCLGPASAFICTIQTRLLSPRACRFGSGFIRIYYSCEFLLKSSLKEASMQNRSMADQGPMTTSHLRSKVSGLNLTLGGYRNAASKARKFIGIICTKWSLPSLRINQIKSRNHKIYLMLGKGVQCPELSV